MNYVILKQLPDKEEVVGVMQDEEEALSFARERAKEYQELFRIQEIA